MSFVAIGGFIVEYAGVISAVSAGVGAVSAISQGDASRRAAHTNADIARQKAKVAANQANVNEDAQRRAGAIAIGRQAAGAADNGGLEGTNAALIQQSATNAEMDALNIRYSGQLGALSGNEQAGLDDMQASDANTAGYLNAGAAALSAGGSYARGTRKTGPS